MLDRSINDVVTRVNELKKEVFLEMIECLVQKAPSLYGKTVLNYCNKIDADVCKVLIQIEADYWWAIYQPNQELKSLAMQYACKNNCLD